MDGALESLDNPRDEVHQWKSINVLETNFVATVTTELRAIPTLNDDSVDSLSWNIRTSSIQGVQ